MRAETSTQDVPTGNWIFWAPDEAGWQVGTASTGGLTCYKDSRDHVWHIIYATPTGEIRDCWKREGGGDSDSNYKRLWSSLFEKKAPPAPAGAVSGGMLRAKGTHQVVYRDGSGHLQAVSWGPCLWQGYDWGAHDWRHADLTHITGAPAADGDPWAISLDSENHRSVVYRDSTGQVYELRAR